MTLEELYDRTLVSQSSLMELYQGFGDVPRDSFSTWLASDPLAFIDNQSWVDLIFKRANGLSEVGLARERALERHWWNCATYAVAHRQGVEAALLWRLSTTEPQLLWKSNSTPS